MELLTYSNNPNSQLNEARRKVWSSKYMLDLCIENPGEYATPELWHKWISEDMAELRKVAHELRAKLPAKRLNLYRVPMISDETGKHCFSVFERAHFNGQACVQAEEKHQGFTASAPEFIE